MRYIIEFRNGTYWHEGAEASGRGVNKEAAGRFITRYAAEQEAKDWPLAGALVTAVEK